MNRRIVITFLLAFLMILTLSPAEAGVRWLRIGVGGMAWPFCASGLEDKVAENLEPKAYNVSVKRAEAVAVFREHRAVSVKKARNAVKKAGFDYLGAELVATGHLEWSGKAGESDLLLKDPKAEMSIRLTSSDTESILQELKTQFQEKNLGDTVQVRGAVGESKKARKQAASAGAQFTLAVTDWTPGRDAKIPPLVPGEPRDEKQQDRDDGWF